MKKREENSSRAFSMEEVNLKDQEDERRILVVDDEQGFRDMLLWHFRCQGMAVEVARDGAEAMRRAWERTFAVVITDLTMPRMDGLELLEEIQKKAPETVVIILTGFGTVETAVYAMKKGAGDFILKPYDLNQLTERVREIMKGKPGPSVF